MGNAIGSILPLALGVAISPVPIIAVILMLFSSRAKANGLAFALGWVLGLTVVAVIVLAVADPANVSSGGPSTAALLLKLAFGLLFIVLALAQWRKRPKPDAEPAMPGWMATIDSFTPAKALVLAALLAGINPKNLALNVSAALTISRAALNGGQTVVALAVFVLIASASVAGPVLYFLIAGARATKTLDGWKAWLIANNVTVMVVLLLVLGTVLVGQAVGGLSA